ncbi:MAG: hypothetical protein EZS28_051847, partial [Streblomastix strix]
SQAEAGVWPLLQIILSSDENLSLAGSQALQSLAGSDNEVRHVLLSKIFVDSVLQILSIGIHNSNERVLQIEQVGVPDYIKVGLLSVVLKVSEVEEGLQELGTLIPILEQLKQNGEKEVKIKAKSILNQLAGEGINVQIPSQDIEKEQKIQQLEEENRRIETVVMREKQEKERILEQVRRQREDMERERIEYEREKEERMKSEEELQKIK